MTIVRTARLSDAAGIGRVHVAAWRSAYAGVLPDAYLAGLSPMRQAAYYQAGILQGHETLVAVSDRVLVGFATLAPRKAELAEGEIETLYVTDDHRDRGIGRLLMQGAAQRLTGLGCRSAFLWVLRDNPSRWFYERLGGRRVAEGQTDVAGHAVAKVAYRWNPIEILLHSQATPEVPE